MFPIIITKDVVLFFPHSFKQKQHKYKLLSQRNYPDFNPKKVAENMKRLIDRGVLQVEMFFSTMSNSHLFTLFSLVQIFNSSTIL